MNNHMFQIGSRILNVQISHIVTPYDHLHYRGGVEILINCSIPHTTSSYKNNMNQVMNTLTHLISLTTVYILYRSICCTSQNTETVIQTFRQPTAAFISEQLTLTGMHVKIQKGSQTMMW